MRLLLLFIALTASAIAAEFPAPFNTESAPGGPMPPDQAAASVRTPPGFRVTMFAAEPDVQQPIAIATDSRGRLWVVECYTYAEAQVNYDTKLRDRILIFEDADNDGRFDKRTVFWHQGERLTSVELGFGGVWVAAAPNLIFIADKNGDDIPDGPPEMLLDGWDTGPIRHNIVNGLRWGPDGWLYGRHGILATSLVGTPGTPAAQRTKMNVGIWRYHPTRKVFEVVANGGTNPWGMDWNEVGEAFFTNTVTGHLWHLIPGAHYERMYGEDANPHVYQLMGMCADHYHFDTGAGWTKSRAAFDGAPASASDALGGGHAHCGALIYQGGQWPEYWRGKVLTINFHGRRLNVERLERKGSGYVAKHEPDAFFFGDPWFRGIDLIQAADGGVFVADWSDASECHDNDGVHRTSGRIYKIVYGDGKNVAAVNPGSTLVPSVGLGVPPRLTSETVEKAESVTADETSKKVHEGGTPSPTLATSVLPGNLAALTDEELIQLQHSRNGWLVRMARRALCDRANSKAYSGHRLTALMTMMNRESDSILKLRAMWMLATFSTAWCLPDGLRFPPESHPPVNVAESDSHKEHRALLNDPDEYVQAWAIRSLTHGRYDRVSPKNKLIIAELKTLSQHSTRFVRTALASAACNDTDLAKELIPFLLEHEEDSGDLQLSRMLWFSVVAMSNREGSESDRVPFEMAAHGKNLLVRRLAIRWLAEEIESRGGLLSDLLEDSIWGTKDEARESMLHGLNEGLSGRRKAPMPRSWNEFASKFGESSNAEIRTRVRQLNVLFGDGNALAEIRAIALDAQAEIPARRQALQSLIDARTPDLSALCEQSLDVRDLAGVAARGLAHFDDPKIGALLVQKYGGIHPHLRPDAIGALVSRPAWAAMLLDAIANAQIARADLGAYHARQIRAFNDDALTKRLAEVWGEVRETDDAKKALVAKLKAQLTPEVLAKADFSAGRVLFTQTCAACHKLHGEGGAFGPDLTGSARELTYLLENITDPSAVVPVDFRMSIVTLNDGRILTGFVGAKTDRAFTLRSLTETQTIERADVKLIADSPQSIMPEGILSALNETQVRDLMSYLMGKAQVPLPAVIK